MPAERTTLSLPRAHPPYASCHSTSGQSSSPHLVVPLPKVPLKFLRKSASRARKLPRSALTLTCPRNFDLSKENQAKISSIFEVRPISLSCCRSLACCLSLAHCLSLACCLSLALCLSFARSHPRLLLYLGSHGRTAPCCCPVLSDTAHGDHQTPSCQLTLQCHPAGPPCPRPGEGSKYGSSLEPSRQHSSKSSALFQAQFEHD